MFHKSAITNKLKSIRETNSFALKSYEQEVAHVKCLKLYTKFRTKNRFVLTLEILPKLACNFALKLIINEEDRSNIIPFIERYYKIIQYN